MRDEIDRTRCPVVDRDGLPEGVKLGTLNRDNRGRRRIARAERAGDGLVVLECAVREHGPRARNRRGRVVAIVARRRNSQCATQAQSVTRVIRCLPVVAEVALLAIEVRRPTVPDAGDLVEASFRADELEPRRGLDFRRRERAVLVVAPDVDAVLAGAELAPDPLAIRRQINQHRLRQHPHRLHVGERAVHAGATNAAGEVGVQPLVEKVRALLGFRCPQRSRHVFAVKEHVGEVAIVQRAKFEVDARVTLGGYIGE